MSLWRGLLDGRRCRWFEIFTFSRGVHNKHFITMLHDTIRYLRVLARSFQKLQNGPWIDQLRSRLVFMFLRQIILAKFSYHATRPDSHDVNIRDTSNPTPLCVKDILEKLKLSWTYQKKSFRLWAHIIPLGGRIPRGGGLGRDFPLGSRGHRFDTTRVWSGFDIWKLSDNCGEEKRVDVTDEKNHLPHFRMQCCGRV